MNDPTLDVLIAGLSALLDTLESQQATRTIHGTQRTYVLSLMSETELPVTPRALCMFAMARDGITLRNRSVAGVLCVLRREGKVYQVRHGHWRISPITA